MNVDFNALYSELGVAPDCGLDELRRAYRRRLSSLHPDRVGERSATQAQLSLQELKQLYERSLQFHRQHGRLPGGRTNASIRPASTANAPPAIFDTPRLAPASIVAGRIARGRRRPWLRLALLLLSAAGIGAFYYHDQTTVHADPIATIADTPATAIDANAAPKTPAIELPTLQIGMSKSEVMAIEGAPIEARDDHWWYGPSWLRFEEDKLAGWYSSQLRPLRVDRQGDGKQALAGDASHRR